MTSKGHCESSLGSFDECSAAHKRLSTLRPSHLTWAVSTHVGSYRLQPPSPFIIITQPESWYSFTVPRRVEGWVDLGTAGKVHTVRAQGCKSQWLCHKHNCQQRDSIRGPRVLQSGMLPLDHCDLHCDVMIKRCRRRGETRLSRNMLNGSYVAGLLGCELFHRSHTFFTVCALRPPTCHYHASGRRFMFSAAYSVTRRVFRLSSPVLILHPKTSARSLHEPYPSKCAA